jgi:methionine aminotransferase
MITSKLPQIGTTIFSLMSALAEEQGALNLSQGFPNFEIDPLLSDLLLKYSKKGFNQYAPMAGVQTLKDVLAQKQNRLYGSDYNSETEVTITSGATEAIFAAIAASVNIGDEVVVFEPAYDSYLPAIELNGGVPVYITLRYPDYKIDWDIVEQKISSKTKVIIVNTPHNPSGGIFDEKDIKRLEEIVANKNILVIGDEVYEHIIFDNIKHRSLSSSDILREKSFVCGSFGKTFHITGWKIGYCLAPQKLSTEFRKIHQYLTFSTFTPAQYALSEYMQQKDHYERIPEFYQRKRDLFLESIKDSRFTFVPSKGSFFQNLYFGNITDKPDFEYAVELTKTIKVASIPISVFYHEKIDDKILRFCFAKDDETLKRAGELLSKI